jgi:protoheme IX farnesyltransferase
LATEVLRDTTSLTRAQSTVRDYVALTKPGIISLLLFTTLCGMMVAANGAPPLDITIYTLIGGYLAAGGANALNCYIDRDIDGIMARTSKRATVTGRIQPRAALIYGLTLSILSILLLAATVNLLAAGLALAGNLYYVVIYTWRLKRTTPQNIVIGGAAGAFPPLVGWAAVTGNLSVLAALMFAIIYYWTPPHFWALALLKQGEYGRAAVPMLPNIVGEAETRKQVLLYTAILAAVSLMPVAFGLGEIYFVCAIILSGLFLMWSARLYLHPSKRLARETFFYSLWYLALIFAAMVVDRVVLG